MIRCGVCRELKSDLIDVEGVMYVCVECRDKEAYRSPWSITPIEGPLVHSPSPGQLAARVVIDLPAKVPKAT
jgi:hypothetical protein